jgi:hypothetical protein
VRGTCGPRLHCSGSQNDRDCCWQRRRVERRQAKHTPHPLAFRPVRLVNACSADDHVRWLLHALATAKTVAWADKSRKPEGCTAGAWSDWRLRLIAWSPQNEYRCVGPAGNVAASMNPAADVHTGSESEFRYCSELQNVDSDKVTGNARIYAPSQVSAQSSSGVTSATRRPCCRTMRPGLSRCEASDISTNASSQWISSTLQTPMVNRL